MATGDSQSNIANINADEQNKQSETINANNEQVNEPTTANNEQINYMSNSVIAPTTTNVSDLEQPKKQSLRTLKAGETLWHPSLDVQRFNSSMIFANVEEVLNQGKKRSFTIFFTTDEHYAKQYAGLWSLNKRDVYLHKLELKKDLEGIKQIDGTLLMNKSINNIDFSSNMCGDSVDGYINAIEVTNKDISEYYICNPSAFFDNSSVETYMLMGPNEWAKLTKGT